MKFVIIYDCGINNKIGNKEVTTFYTKMIDIDIQNEVPVVDVR